MHKKGVANRWRPFQKEERRCGVQKNKLKAVINGIVGSGALERPRYAFFTMCVLLGIAAVIWLLAARHQEHEHEGDAFPFNRGGAVAELTDTLARSSYGPGGVEIRVLWATDDYFRLTGQNVSAEQYDAKHNLVFFIWENIHDRNLGDPPWLTLRIDGGALYEPSRVITSTHAEHHRFSIALYRRYDDQGNAVAGEQARFLEVILPPVNTQSPPAVLFWALPIEHPYAQAIANNRFSFSGAAILALLGGLFISMWPCLFQLTAYFIPMLAGLSMSQTRAGSTTLITRLQVLKTAAFFVLGFVIVYTAVGVAAGFAGQSVGGSDVFWSWQRPLSVVAGIVIVLMALRLAANARAPLACKMPITSFWGKKKFGPLGTMLLGVAFAVGCTTCFGAALIMGLIAYIGIAATPLWGALIMFAFSLGIAVPLMIGAVLMTRVLGFLSRLERIAPYLIIGSSIVMIVFGMLLLTNHFMEVSNLLFEALSR